MEESGKISLTLSTAVFWGVILSLSCHAEAAPKEKNKFSLTIKCGGDRPHGEVQYEGKRHLELSGANEMIPDKSDTIVQRRFVHDKKTDCWLKYYIPNPPSVPWRSSGSFHDAFYSAPPAMASDDVAELNLIGTGNVYSFLKKNSPAAARCAKAFEPINAAYEKSGFGQGWSSEKLQEWSREGEVFSSCLDNEISLLDGRGFLGVWFDGSKRRGYAWLDGRLLDLDIQ